MDSGTAFQEFLEYVVSQLVDRPDRASIKHDLVQDRHVFRIQLDEQDVGRVIGRNGYTLSAIRSLLNAAAARSDTKVGLKVYRLSEDPAEAPTLVD